MEENLSKYSGGVTLITGSRSIHSYKLLKQVIEKSSFDIQYVLHGGASGVDSLGERWVVEHNIPRQLFIPKWEDLLRGSRIERTAEMVTLADQAIILLDYESYDMKDAVLECKKKGIPYYLHIVQN